MHAPSSSPRKVDQDDVRGLTHAVEDDLFPVRGDVEGVFVGSAGEPRDLSGLLRSKVQDPEVICSGPAGTPGSSHRAGNDSAVCPVLRKSPGRATGEPSGRTARTCTLPLMIGPEYTISVSSGDQAGLVATPLTNRIGCPPSMGTLNRPGPCSLRPPITIHCESGDQSAAPWTLMDDANACASAPSADIIVRCRLPSLLRTTATLRPSRDTAGVSPSAPSEPFQISDTWPSRKRQSPSPVPPRADR